VVSAFLAKVVGVRMSVKNVHVRVRARVHAHVRVRARVHVHARVLARVHVRARVYVHVHVGIFAMLNSTDYNQSLFSAMFLDGFRRLNCCVYRQHFYFLVNFCRKN
jgi:hypothetical protein